ncbi:MAG TPA: hypothetical protein VFQ67_08015 [Allosphingosinicella sp.]|jgi:hypothetical protein|nr:hypothetical protein [Allosphingosinicella sp.]
MPPEASADRDYSPPPHQARVDAIQAAIRAEGPGRPGLFRPPPARPARSERAVDLRVAEEMELAARHIEQVGDALVADPAFLHRHGAALQALDLINQNLRHLAAVVAAADKELAAERISLEELRRRLTRKSIRPIGS